MIHLYHGDNDFEIKQQVALIKDRFSKQYGAENVIKPDLSEIDNVLAELMNASLFSENRLVILEGVFSNKVLVEKLPEVLSLIPETTEVVIIDSKPDKRTKLYKTLLLGNVKEFALPKNLNQFVKNEAEKQKVKLNPDAVDDLIAYSSGDIWRIVNEIAKFKTLNKNISRENIEKYIEPDLTTNTFQILDNVFNQQPEQALNKIRTLKQKEDPNKFFALLSSQVFALAVVKNSNKSSNLVAKESGLHPFVVSKMQSFARGVTHEKVSYIAKIIAETDAKIKLSNKDEAWSLIELVVRKI